VTGAAAAAPSGDGLAGALDLLDRALAYTREQLASVGPGDLGRSTPCRAWTLGELLAHMEDSLDAFTEAASGSVALRPTEPAPPRPERLRRKACALQAAWTHRAQGTVDVAGASLPDDLLVAAATLEIAVHGWDVGRALGFGTPLPEPLARPLLPLARRLVRPEDRVTRFGPPVAVSADATASRRLLAHLGR
jgi:uncharacterized protein (TIGR03086 family)